MEEEEVEKNTEIKPIIKLKALELISKEIGNLDNGPNLIKFLVECGVKREQIVYPNTKWRMIYEVLEYLANSGRKEDQIVLFRIIQESTHPLMNEGNLEKARLMEEKFNKYLQFDNLLIVNSKIIKDQTDLVQKIKKNNIYLPKPEWIEELGLELHKRSIDQNADEKFSCAILLEEVVQYHDDFGEVLSAENFADKTEQNTKSLISYFIAKKIIEDGYIMECGTIINENEYGEEFNIDGALVYCSYYPKKSIEFLENLYLPKRNSAQNIVDLYLKLIEITEIYFKEPITRNEKLNSFYLKTLENLENMINKAEIPDLKIYSYYKPFSNLLAAQREMQMKKEVFQDILNSMNAFYGELHKILARYSLVKKEGNIKGLEGYLISLKKEKGDLVKSNQENKKIELKAQKIEFDDDKAIIIIGEKNVRLPPYKNEHYFCKIMFQYKPREPISWDIIYDEMTKISIVSNGRQPEPTRENWQKVNDTMKRLNNRIKDILGTEDDLFCWSEKTVIRNY